MVSSNIKAVLEYDIQRVWDKVTSFENYSWRSDLIRIKVINEEEFVEYTRKGYPTAFTVTVVKPYERWEFDMENSNMKGHWTGIFTRRDGRTEIDFTEDVTVKKWFMKPFVKAFLKKQQEQYVADLKRGLLLEQKQIL